jgi:hypothetical protein
MKAILRLYQALAMFILYLVTGLLSLQVLAQALQSDDPPIIYSAAFDSASYYFSSPEEVAQIGEDFDRMGEQESYMFNPWTTFTERPFDGELVHIDQASTWPTRRTLPQVMLDPAKPRLLVWAMGASSMFGWGVSDGNTIASHLQQELQALLPTYQVQVVNHGHSYFFSSLEVALYIALLRTDPMPNAVVFLNGVNDANWVGRGYEVPPFTAQAESAWEQQRAQRYQTDPWDWVEFNASFPPLRFIEYLALFSDTPNSVIPPSTPPENPARAVMLTYTMNYQMARSISATFGVKAYFFLQPIRIQLRQQAPFAEVYTAWLADAQLSQADDFHSLDGLFQGGDRYYVDNSHYSDLGNYLIGQAMAQIIAPDFQAPSQE